MVILFLNFLESSLVTIISLIFGLIPIALGGVAGFYIGIRMSNLLGSKLIYQIISVLIGIIIGCLVVAIIIYAYRSLDLLSSVEYYISLLFE